VQSRSRSIVQQAQQGGYMCPYLVETRECNESCPVSCQVSAFSAWSNCSEECGDGVRSRSRSVVTDAAHGGYACPYLDETQACHLKPCPIDCVYTWSNWTNCSSTCGEGESHRHPIITTPHDHEGQQCPQLQTVTCNNQSCPIDCVQTNWGNWSTCDKSCGSGSRSRFRDITTAMAYNGASCGASNETMFCNTHPCQVDCVYSSWGSFSSCSSSCGSGTHSRSRSILQDVQHGGKQCPMLQDTADCNTFDCPTDCVLNDWNSWEACTKNGLTVTCGGGRKTRTRGVATAPVYGGDSCDAEQDEDDCEMDACPVHCAESEWSTWSECTESCNEGYEVRTRSVVTAAANSGEGCGDLEQTQSCNSGPCPVHCEVGPFGEWDDCSKNCSTGFQTRTREITRHAYHGGYACPFLGEYRKCNEQPCPIDCVLDNWGAWTPCTLSCGKGQTTRERTEDVPPLGGKACGATEETQDCNDHACPESCIEGNWGTWTPCSNSCGTGQATRLRPISRSPAFGGKLCGHRAEAQSCNVHACPLDCQVSAWSSWSECSTSCGAGKHNRTRSIIGEAQHGGGACGTLTEEGDCNHLEEDGCPVDCLTSEWTGWTECSKSCGSGFTSHERSVIQAPLRNGTGCGKLVETIPCNGHHCSVDCVVSDWSSWGECSQECGGGERSRSRDILTLPLHGGITCPSTSELKPCNTEGCVCSHVSCEFSKHSSTGHMRIKVLHHSLEQKGHSHVCGYDYESSSCQCKCFGVQKWDPTRAHLAPADDWQAKNFSLGMNDTVPALSSAPTGVDTPSNTVKPLTSDYVVRNATPGVGTSVPEEDRNPAYVLPPDHHRCTNSDGDLIGTILQEITGFTMKECMAACNEDNACKCSSMTSGNCQLSTGALTGSSRTSYRANAVGNAGEQEIQRLGLVNMVVPDLTPTPVQTTEQ
jgi:hypothetical protein